MIQLQFEYGVSQTMRARLKAKIEGPKDAIFFAERERRGQEPESDLEDFDSVKA